MNGVGDRGEVAGLGAVAIDEGFLPFENGFDEAGDDGGIGGIGALPRTEDIEIAEGDAGDAVATGVGP